MNPWVVVVFAFCFAVSLAWLAARSIRQAGDIDQIDDDERRNHDALAKRMEQAEGWVRLLIEERGGTGWPAGLVPYEPEPAFVSREIVVIPLETWPTGGAEADDQSASARLLPRLDPPRRSAEHSETSDIEPNFVVEPETAPIPIDPCPTVPAAVVVTHTIASIDDWEARQKATFEAAMAEIRGAGK